MPDQHATISLQWQTADQLKTATIVVHAEGLDLDDALDIVADGAEARGYAVTRTQVVETVTRPGRDRLPARKRAEQVAVAEGEPAQIRSVKVKGGVLGG